MSGTDSDIDLCYKVYDNIHEANNHGSPTKIGVTARNLKKTDPAFRKLKLLLFDDLFGIKTKKVHKKMSYLRAGFDYAHRGNRRYLSHWKRNMKLLMLLLNEVPNMTAWREEKLRILRLK